MHHQAVTTPPHSIQFPKITSTHRNIISPTIYSPSNSSFQIQLPLRKPQPKHHKPIKQSPKKINVNDNNPRTCSSTSVILRLMDSLKLPITLDLYVSLIKECTNEGDCLEAVEIHNHVMRSGISINLPLLNLLLLMHVCCNGLLNARELFDRSPSRNAYSWALVIAAYFESGDYKEVINLFLEMQSRERTKGRCDDVSNIAVSGIIVCVLKACVKTGNFELGQQVHGLITKAGCSRSVVLISSLMWFYGECGSLENSDCVFNQVPNENMVVWTARIVNCCKEERFHEAVHVFREMGQVGVKKNCYTFSIILRACGKIGDDGCHGRQIHAGAIKLGLEFNGYVQCGLVDMYGKCGSVNDAKSVFNMSAHQSNVACWNALVNGYMQQGLYIEAIKILYEMKAAGLVPQESVLHELISLCGSYGIEKRRDEISF